MKIYYLVNKKLGWDNVCAMGLSIKNVFANFFEDDVVPATDEECLTHFKDRDLVLLDKPINTEI